MKSFPLLRTTLAGVIALGLGTGYALPGAADDTAASKVPTASPTSAPAQTGNKDKDDDSDEPPTTLVTPSQDTADSDESDTAKTTADANHCTQCQIQADAYRKLKAEADDANDNIKKNQDVQSKLKPDEDKSAWIKVESNLRMWDIKVESLKKNLSALEAQMKQDCQGCPNVTVPTDAATPAPSPSPSPTPSPSPSAKAKRTKKK